MAKSHLPTALFLSALLTACGTNTPVTATGNLTPPTSTTTTNQERAAYLDSQSQPPEGVQTEAVTELSQTMPGGHKVSAQALNTSVPIVLIHGFVGFGRNELGGVIKYWGGIYDVQEDLRSKGYNVFTAAVGPISSNWDRAAELYAQIKGGCVDYGAARAAQYGHDRFDTAKCYPGFYPQWDAQHPINLIGHSQGGQTSRMLVKLLEDGSPANADGNNLFVGGRVGWVNNVMMISAPGDGSPAADNLQTLIPNLQKTLMSLAATAADLGLNPIYDFKLGQYHLKRQPGETLDAYIKRVMGSPIMTSHDSSAWDLRPDGAKELNAFIGRSKVTKYFSWATNDTSPGLLTGWAYPNITMNPIIKLTAYPYPRPMLPGLGNVYGSSMYGGYQYNSSWWPNDGLVPSNYMGAPAGQSMESYSGQVAQAGHWYDLGRLNGYDHLAIIGVLSPRDVRVFYRNQAAFLSSQN
ncbi:triacylglycerol lipase [Deinococcus sp.]|uniref:esterase/lipase family protein n=1 Tax=Deinococcus sp. TaxID=47478 RepID=UPI0025C216E3|nr:triacylglycerol lipase [Deinococcus sp.]